MKRTGAELVVKALEDEGIALAFGIPGTHNIELYDALDRSDAVTAVLVTDEAERLRRGKHVDARVAVIALGGDGTANEIINGMLGDEGPGPDVPAFGIVPGGSANVFSRSIGFPQDPIEATGELIAALRDRRTRTIGLGRADNRWFLCNAGLGKIGRAHV